MNSLLDLILGNYFYSPVPVPWMTFPPSGLDWWTWSNFLNEKMSSTGLPLYSWHLAPWSLGILDKPKPISQPLSDLYTVTGEGPGPLPPNMPEPTYQSKQPVSYFGNGGQLSTLIRGLPSNVEKQSVFSPTPVGQTVSVPSVKGLSGLMWAPSSSFGADILSRIAY